ncbi:L-lysine 2,3-aminomutase [[Clostridium] bifermentans ATCC 638]|uniref:L-lysine 2,3-aminomutase n=1 Tax=Paraclostridium bifermentans ATCC 638 = DSM 14991 TaxID=1233171 RepID=T4VPI8_PARBF|nr:glutamate 2,3-aminomutase [Paraclostridium bifermentans]EQK43443.1 L-lysine 2,3-aminomutase [[Clostridium] bifermentans ATCC 638] [Paraclostridium bifermentans ATCC 638 = DSM 14991]RIZ58164.1 glutamate 2,3-aminomutase [Paraclostridium bifermentans]UAG17299.1 glutamate 2,3-aminomutase [Paraclostridium bifermentans]
MNEKNKISLERASELKSRIEDYIKIKDTIPTGIKNEESINYRKRKILEVLNAKEEDWDDYKWQLSNRITDVDMLSKILSLTEKEVENIKNVQSKFRWAISPYYLSLIDPNNPYDAIKLMSIPSSVELDESISDLDPMGEEFTNPAGSITRRYPDRLIINVTNECAMYCRHCQRRRNIGQEDCKKSKEVIKESINYIKENTEIRDVLITGGDPLTLNDDMLEWIISEIRKIDHVDYIRLGSRTLVTMPQRITDEFCNMIKKYHPIYINTHFNNPMEITKETKEACEKLANNGVPLGNQAVLLNGVNNDKYLMRCLNHELLKIRVKPYYIFHSKHVKGTTHFNTSVDEGMEIMEYLRGYTSGMAIPTYIINAPKGKGKTPLLPQYLISKGSDYIMIRTWEGEVVKVEDNKSVNIKDVIDKSIV